MDDVLHVEIEGPVATVWLNRPEVRNALNALLIGGLREAMTSLDANADVAAIVLTGADPAFCAGLDLHDLAEGTLSGGGSARRSRPTWAHRSSARSTALRSPADSNSRWRATF